MYYIFDFATDKNIIGSEFPQIQKMTANYNYDSTNSVYALGRCYENLPNFNPDLDGFILHSKSLRTDFISNAIISNGFIVSKRVKDILKQFSLPLHAFYSIDLYHKKQAIDNYYWLHLISDLTDYVDYPKSSFFIYKDYTYNLGAINISSKEDFLFQKTKLKEQNKEHTITIWAERLFLNREIKYDLFEVGMFDSNHYITESLKVALEIEKVTGITISPSPILHK